MKIMVPIIHPKQKESFSCCQVRKETIPLTRTELTQLEVSVAVIQTLRKGDHSQTIQRQAIEVMLGWQVVQEVVAAVIYALRRRNHSHATDEEKKPR